MLRRLRSDSIFGWLALGAVGYHGVAMALLHLWVRAVDPISDHVGAYLGSQYPLLSPSTFLALGIALAALGLGLRTSLPRGVLFRISAGLLLVAVVGFLGVAIAPGAARYFGIPTRPATVLSILSLSLVLRAQPPWQRIGSILVLIGCVLLTLYVLTIVLGILDSMGLGGLANRAVLVLIYVWVVFVARGLLRRSYSSRELGAA